MSARLSNVMRDESGASFLEFTAVVFAFLVIVLGFVDFSYVFYQWNSATKAVQFGARLAAVSDPVVQDFRDLDGLSEDVLPGDPMPEFSYTCTAATTDGSSGSCGDGAEYDAAAMQALVFGRDSEGVPRLACEATETDRRRMGMCNFYSKIDDVRFVVVGYNYTGLGYAGRPGGPVPTVTVSLAGMTYDYAFLGDLLGLSSVVLPSFATTVTGEDLNAVAGS